MPPLPGGHAAQDSTASPAPRGRPTQDTASHSDALLPRHQPHGSRRMPTAPRQPAPGTAGAPAEPGWCRGSAGNGPEGEGREGAAPKGLTRGDREGGALAKLPLRRQSHPESVPSASYPPRASSGAPPPRRRPRPTGDSPACNQAATEEGPRWLPPGSRPRTTAPGSPRGAERPPAQTTSPTMRRAACCGRPPATPCGAAGAESGAGRGCGLAARLGGPAGRRP